MAAAFLFAYLKRGNWRWLIGLVAITCAYSFFAFELALGFVAVAALVSLAVSIKTQTIERFFIATITLALGLCLAGIWLVPALSGALNLDVFEDLESYGYLLVTICFAFAFTALFFGAKPKKLVIAAGIIVVIAANVYPALHLYRYISAGSTTPFEQSAEVYQAAVKNTKQYIAVFDGEHTASVAVADSTDIASVDTRALRKVSASESFTQLNLAFRAGEYRFVFDRLLSAGCDSVVVNLGLIKGSTLSDVSNAAAAAGYKLTEQDNSYVLYHLTGATSSFTSPATYTGLAIGTNTAELVRLFPSFTVAESTNLNDFTFDDLSSYETLYLDGFTYSDKDAAESLIEKVALSGVHVVISGSGIPLDTRTAASSFIGVQAHALTLSNTFPELTAKSETYDLSRFPAGADTWPTCYLTGLDEVTLSFKNNLETVSAAGTVYKKLITFVGLDLVHYASLTQDSEACELLEDILDTNQEALPRHTLNTGKAQSADSLSTLQIPEALRNHGMQLTVAAALATLLFFVVLYVWERHLIKVNEVEDMAKRAFEVARASTTSAAADVEPSDWSVEEWTTEQIQGYIASRPVIKRFTTYPSLAKLSELQQQMGPEAWRQASDAAQVLASYLSCHPQVMAVRYPGLKSDPMFDEAASVLRGGFGPYVWFATASGSQFVDCTNESDPKELVLKIERYVAQD